MRKIAIVFVSKNTREVSENDKVFWRNRFSEHEVEFVSESWGDKTFKDRDEFKEWVEDTKTKHNGDCVKVEVETTDSSVENIKFVDFVFDNGWSTWS